MRYKVTGAGHSGPHLRNERTTENRFYAKLGIYQYGREWWLRSNLTSGLSSCTQKKNKKNKHFHFCDTLNAFY